LFITLGALTMKPLPEVALGVSVKAIAGVHPSEFSFAVQYVAGGTQVDPTRASECPCAATST
jgi:hypothetical protein